MAIENKVKRGDYVAICEIVRREWKLGATHETEERWSIAVVASATRDGIIKRAYLRPSDQAANRHYEMAPSEIRTLSAGYQEAASALFAKQDERWDFWLSSADELVKALMTQNVAA
jgi:hypothetical protein